MRIGIKAKQVAAVTSIVGLTVVALSLLQLASLARVSVQESRERANILINAIFHRAFQVVPHSSNPYEALRDDPGLRSILESSNYSKGFTYAAIVDVSGVVIAHSDPAQVGTRLHAARDLEGLLGRNGLEIYGVLRTSEGQTLEVWEPLRLSGAQFGSIRVGVSTLLVREKELNEALRSALITALIALLVSTLVAMSLAQLFLRPIHVIRSALSRLGQGELGVTVDMPQRDEFGELGSFFNALSAQLSADRTSLAGEKAQLESIVDHLEDAVAIFSPGGELLFANPAMRATLPSDPFARPIDDVLPAGHPYRQAVEETLANRQSRGPIATAMPEQGRTEPAEGGQRLIIAHAIKDLGGRLVGVMLVARNLDYLSRVQSTINYSRKLVALGRLSAGVAHEVKNPLNAMTIHLELLKQKLAVKVAPHGRNAMNPLPPGTVLRDGPAVPAAVVDGVLQPPSTDVGSALEHVKIIANEIRRLDEVVQGFLKFTRPEDLKLQAINVKTLVEEVVRVVEPEAAAADVQVQIDCADSVPDISGDPGMLRQALLNLAINACQAMPAGGRLRIASSAARGRRVEITVEDTGVGISPQDLERIFNLYFTTKPQGSGIGLSMVYRTVQLHDGDIEVQSTPGVGTTFRMLLPQL
jgi:signal transduction histidine kinase/HAMP domain-containing protein